MVNIEDEDGSRDRRPTYLQLASLLQKELQDARAGMGARANPKLAEILEFAAQEFGIGTEECAKSMQPCRKKAKQERAMGSKRVVKVKEQLTCDHSCRGHKEVMSPNVFVLRMGSDGPADDRPVANHAATCYIKEY